MKVTTSVPSSDMMTRTASSRWSTAEDWECYKSRITQLYLEQDKPLKEVMAIMQRDHGFKATVKMYKTHITKWELDKKNKAHEIMAIVRKKRHRDAVGKASEFYVRGRRVSIEDVHRYLKRKAISVEDATAMGAATPPSLRCCTPDFVPSPPNPEILEVPLQIFLGIRNYIRGSLESKTWFSTSSDRFRYGVRGTQLDLGHAFDVSLHAAHDLLSVGRFQNAGRFLVQGSAIIRNLLLEEDPQMLPRLFHAMIGLTRSGWIDISNIILDQFSAMAAVTFPEMHPLRKIFQHFSCLDPELAKDILANAWRSFLDTCDETSYAPSFYSIQNRTRYIFDVVRLQSPEAAEGQLRAVVDRCEAVYGSLHPLRIDALLRLGECLLGEGRYVDALPIAEGIIDIASRGTRGRDVYYGCRGMVQLARSHYGLIHDELAEAAIRQAIATSTAYWGCQDPVTLQLLTKLETFLTGFGKLDEAAQVSKQIAGMLKESSCFV